MVIIVNMSKKNKLEKFKILEKKDLLQGLCKKGGTENLLCIIVVTAFKEIEIINMINFETAIDYYTDEGTEYIESNFDFEPGIYLVEFRIDGCGPDFCGEYDSWSEFENIIQYEIDILDRSATPYNKKIMELNYLYIC